MGGQLFVISAPSGAGKSTILNAVRAQLGGLAYSVSHTTRDPRGEEADGLDYYFVPPSDFRNMVERGEFVEWAEVYGHLYGTSLAELNRLLRRENDVTLDVDSQGARNIRRHFSNSVLIYILPPSLEELESRLRERGTDDESVIRSRMREAVREIQNCLWYDYVVFNDKLGTSVEEVQSIIVSERCRTPRREDAVRRRFPLEEERPDRS